jgi:hypothetical protein
MLRRRHLGIAIMITRKFLALGILGMAAAGMLAQPASAHGGWGGGWGGGWHGGWGGGWRGGWGVGVGIAPFYAVPPYYYYPPYPPPAYYAPPSYYPPPAGYDSPSPGYIAQDPSAAGTPAQSCNAGPYVCPMEVPVPSGARCYCPGNSGQRVYGSAE